jgi:chromosome segregation ATPase
MLHTSFSRLISTRTLWAAGAVALGVVGVASGQAHRPAASLDELVVEVQALRAEMNQKAALSIRVQMLIGRLQIEDQRIADVSRELDAVQADLVKGTRARTDIATRLKEAEDALNVASPDARDGSERAVAALHETAQQEERRQQFLKRREAALAREVQEGQTRWTDMNTRLEHVEQALVAAR